jgi:hypothetical protein
MIFGFFFAIISSQKRVYHMRNQKNFYAFILPRDYVSVEDFYKVYGYACLYISLNKAPVTDLTITFAGSRYPKTLIRHLRGVRNFSIEERSRGIYTVTGDIIPLQIIESRRLPAEENGWLRDLNHSLSPGELLRISTAVDRLGKAADLRAYLDALFRANPGSMKEILQMSEAALTLEQVFEEAGLISKWEARGEVRGEARGETQGKFEVARNLIAMGLNLEQVTKATGLDREALKSL